jgi:hypothetical protein
MGYDVGLSSIRVFTTNTDYRVAGASSLSQNPLFIVEGHASRNLTTALWVSADAYYNVGGETSIDWGSASATPPARCDSCRRRSSDPTRRR